MEYGAGLFLVVLVLARYSIYVGTCVVGCVHGLAGIWFGMRAIPYNYERKHKTKTASILLFQWITTDFCTLYFSKLEGPTPYLYRGSRSKSDLQQYRAYKTQ